MSLAEMSRPPSPDGGNPSGEMGQIVQIWIGQLKEGLTPRLGGLDAEHVRLLASASEELPPILVHRATNRVIDGHHRLSAAKLRGDSHISAALVDGSDDQCFLLAVRSNVRHGKPLSLVERREAAVRIMSAAPDRSDRVVAEVCGLSPGTVAVVRRRTANSGNHSRVSRDGRTRPLDTSAARMKAAELLRSDPAASIRSVARSVGVSSATIRDVRDRVRRGDSPVPERDRPDSDDVKRHPPKETLRTDPAFGHVYSARTFADWFDDHNIQTDDWVELITDLPLGRLYEIIDEARRRSQVWTQLAERLEERVRNSPFRAAVP